MDTESIANTFLGKIFIRIIAAIMESRLRYAFFGPKSIVQGADVKPGQTVLELGCGTGFFTPSIAEAIGEQGSLIAMDVLPASVEFVAGKIAALGIRNARATMGDATRTGLDSQSVDAVLLFGVIPAPMLPMEKLLPEMRRILKPGGVLAVWPPSWAISAIPRSGLFTLASKRNGVANFRRE